MKPLLLAILTSMAIAILAAALPPPHFTIVLPLVTSPSGMYALGFIGLGLFIGLSALVVLLSSVINRNIH